MCSPRSLVDYLNIGAYLWQLDRYAGHTAALRNVEVHPYLLFRNVEAWKLLSKPR